MIRFSVCAFRSLLRWSVTLIFLYFSFLECNVFLKLGRKIVTRDIRSLLPQAGDVGHGYFDTFALNPQWVTVVILHHDVGITPINHLYQSLNTQTHNSKKEQPWWVWIRADKMNTWNQLNIFNTFENEFTQYESIIYLWRVNIYANIYLTALVCTLKEISTFITGQSLKFQYISWNHHKFFRMLTLPYSLWTLTATPHQTCLQALVLHPQRPRQEANAKNKPQKVHSNALSVFVKAHQTWVVTAN